MKAGDIVYFFHPGAGFLTFEKLRITGKEKNSEQFICKSLKVFICPEYALENRFLRVGRESMYHKSNIHPLNRLNKTKIIKVIYEKR